MNRTLKMPAKSVISIFICIFALLFYSVTLFEKVSFTVLLSFYLNLVVHSVLIIRSLENNSFSFEFIHSFFMIYMLTFAPLMQYSTTGSFLSYQTDDSNIVLINIAILTWTLAFQLGRKSKKILFDNVNTSTHYWFNIPKSAEYIATMLMIVLAIIRIRLSGLSIFRNSSAQTLFSGNGLSVLLFAIRISVVIIAVSISIYRYKYSSKISITLIINLALCFVIAFPTSIPRFLAATIYGGIILMIFDKLKINKIYPIALLIGFIVVFPLLNNFRYESNDINLIYFFKKVIGNFENEYNTGNYDGYMMFFRTIDYVNNNNITYGYSLLGNILFFIPRSLWPTKPVGSGSMITGYLNFSFTNYSEALIAESYLNFGVIGIILYAFLIGRITKKIDAIYWNDPSNLFFQLTYTFYIHIFMMLLRGDFMTGFLYIFIMTITYMIYYKIFRLGHLKSVAII